MAISQFLIKIWFAIRAKISVKNQTFDAGGLEILDDEPTNSDIDRVDLNLPKAPVQLTEEDFEVLLKLSLDRPWLQYQSKALFYLWNSTENADQKWVVEKLLRQFVYLEDKDFRELGVKLAKHISHVWGLQAENTLIVSICNKDEVDGSQLLVQALKNKFEDLSWSEKNFLSRIDYLANKLKDNWNIVLVDDFVGTGRTMRNRIKDTKILISNSKLRNVSLFFVAGAAMEFAKARLDTLNVPYFSSIWLKKGITELIEVEKRALAKTEMKKLEKKLSKRWDNRELPTFGFDKSESLFAHGDLNVPNNVFPIFWWPYDHQNQLRKRLFKRVSENK